MTFIKIMFFLATPWMYLASLVVNIYRRLLNKPTYHTDFEIMSGMYTWVMPIGALLTLYVLMYWFFKLLRWVIYIV